MLGPPLGRHLKERKNGESRRQGAQRHVAHDGAGRPQSGHHRRDFSPGKKVVAFALPGAFTPTCSAKHVPGFVAEADKL